MHSPGKGYHHTILNGCELFPARMFSDQNNVLRPCSQIVICSSLSTEPNVLNRTAHKDWVCAALCSVSVNQIVVFDFSLVIFAQAQVYWFYNRIFNLLFLARFYKTLFLPEFLSNQLEILTQHSQSSQEGFCGFSKTSGLIQDSLDHYPANTVRNITFV